MKGPCDPLAWEHIAGATLGGAVLIGMGGVMIYAGIDLCAGILTCIAGAMLVVPGVVAVPVGGVLMYGGYKFAESYSNEVFKVTP